MHRIFETPEIVSLICRYLQLHCDGRTALVSTYFFRGMLPHLVELTVMSSLFKRGLIPAKWTERNGVNRVIRVSRIPKPLSADSMARFHIYGPFIKTLIGGSFLDTLEVRNWDPLISYSQTTQLLPNLVEFQGSRDDFKLCEFLLPGSICNLMIRDHDLPTTASTKEVLDDIAARCPNILKLEFSCELKKADDGNSAEGTPLQTFASLSSFQNLRSLASSSIVIQSSTLQQLAQLPRLTELVIREKSDTISAWDSSSCQQLPPSSFPALETLCLELETCRDMKRFWELVPLAKLTRAFLTIQVARDGDEGEDNFVPLLCQASPRIRSLRLTFSDRADFNEEDRNIHRISAETFQHLSRLPLDEYLFLGSTKFDFDDAWVIIARTWPALRDIRCLHQPISLAELVLLSTALPNLFQIECDLGLEQAIRMVHPNWRPVGESQCFPNIHTLIIKDSELREHASSYEYNLSDLARFFAYFWPNMRIQSNSAYSRRDSEDEVIWKYNQALFDMFQKLVDAHVKSFYH